MGGSGVLSDVALFRRCTVEQRDRIAALGRTEDVAAGHVVFRQGEPGAGLCVLVSGRLRVDRVLRNDEAHELFTVAPGGVVGEPALFEEGPRIATVTAVAPSRLLVFDRAPFLELASGSPDILWAMVCGLSETLRSGYDEVFSGVLERRAVEAAAAADRYRSLAQLVAGVAHEVNTPLGVVNIAASVVADGLAGLQQRRSDWTDPAVADAIEASVLIQRNLARANTLVQSFKSLSARQAVDRVEEVDPDVIVREVLAVSSPQARADHLEVVVRDERADRRSRWTGSPSHLAQVLLNLLTNAGRYAYPDGRGGAVEVIVGDAPATEADGIALTVRDFGQGIPAEDQARVLEPFFTTGRHRGGTGLGLSIVHTLVTEAMGGKLEIDSTPGQGTAVRITVPSQPPP